MSRKFNKITFITRHYPPNPNINGESVWDIVKYLKNKHNIESAIITTNQSFFGGGETRQPVGKVIKYDVPFKGKGALNKLGNLWAEGRNLVKLALNEPDSLIIVTTSPPLLPMWANIIYSKHKNVTWGVWFFDLFPEFFVADKTFGQNNPLFKLTLKKTYQNKPNFFIALGEKQAEYLQKKYNSSVPYLILPCGIFYNQHVNEQTPEWLEPNKISLCYCGRLGQAHNPLFLKAVIDNLDTDKYQLILAVYGEKADEIINYAKDRKGIIIKDRVPRSQLHFIDIHLVSLKKEWTHIAVPSKAVSAVTMGSSYIFCGSQESDTWYMLQEAGWLIEENGYIEQQVKKLLDSITPADVINKKKAAEKVTIKLKKYVIDTYEALATQEFLK